MYSTFNTWNICNTCSTCSTRSNCETYTIQISAVFVVCAVTAALNVHVVPVMWHSQILATWSFSSNLDIVPWIEEKIRIGAEFQQFSRENKCVRVHGKLSEIHYKVLLFSNPGDNICFLVKVRDRFVPLYFTFYDLVPWIREETDFGTIFLEFSRHPDILVNPGKLLELLSNMKFFSNPGDKVKITAEISWSQDLRVSLIHLEYLQ